MTGRSKTFTVSLPPELAAQMEDIMREERRTRSELLREALRQYIEEREWKRLQRYAERKAMEKGVATEEQVDELVHARRIRKGQIKGSAGQ